MTVSLYSTVEGNLQRQGNVVVLKGQSVVWGKKFKLKFKLDFNIYNINELIKKTKKYIYIFFHN